MGLELAIADSRSAPPSAVAAPARRLVLAPRGAAEPFPSIARVVELARERRRFALIVPTRPALEHVKNEVARRAGAVDPLAFHTMLGLAKRILGARMPRLATPRERDVLLERALRGLPEPETARPGTPPTQPPGGRGSGTPPTQPLEELRRASRFRGFRRALLQFFSEVETLGIDPRGLATALRRTVRAPAGAYSRALSARLTEAFRAFRSELAHAELASEADILARAARAVERGLDVPAFDTIIIDGFVELAPKQLDLILALSARAQVTELHRAELQGPDEGLRRAFEARGFEVREETAGPASSPRAAAIEHVVSELFAAREPRDEAGAVSFVRAGSPADEALSALKVARAAVLDRGRAWHEVLVVVPDARAAVEPFERAARELSVPVRVHAARPLADHPAVRGALAFVRAAATLATDALLAAAQAPAVGLVESAAEALAREVRRRGTPAIEGLDLAALDSRARAFVRDVLELGRLLGGRGPLAAGAALAAARQALRGRARGPLLAELSLVPDQAAIEAAADEVSALQSLDALLGELAGLLAGDVIEDGAALVARIEAEARESEHTPRDRRRFVVHVVDVAEARSWRASVAIVCGLTEGSFPRPWRSDLLLDDGARRAFSRALGANERDPLAGRLLTGDDHAERERQLFLHAVSCARDELHLVHAAFDERGEPVAPSPFVAAVESLFTPEALGRSQRRRAPSDAIPQGTGEIVTLADARRFAALRAAATFRPGSAQESRARAGAALLERILARPQDAASARRALARPAWRLEQGPGFAALDHSYSASELETFAACPYRHFVRHVLQARRRDELAVTGLDARLQGKIVHRALERAVLLAEAPGAAFDAAFAEVARDLPLGPDEEAFRRSARAGVERFLLEDDPRFLARTGLARWRVEVEFGARTEAGPLVVEDTALGGKILLEGRIDRIDEGPRGAFVTDYKLGKEEVDPRTREAMARGEKLQLQVYLLAVARVLGKEPLGASLVALRSRRRTGIVRGEARDLAGSADNVAINPVDLDRLLFDAEESIRKIVREIARGRIDAQPRLPKDCKRCDVRDVCRFRERGAAGSRTAAAGGAA